MLTLRRRVIREEEEDIRTGSLPAREVAAFAGHLTEVNAFVGVVGRVLTAIVGGAYATIAYWRLLFV